MTHKTFLVVLLLTILYLPGYSQNSDSEDNNSNLLDKIFVGGNFRMDFGSRTFIEASPTVGYNISPRFAAGVGGVYQYVHFRASDISIHTYGSRLFVRGGIVEPFFGQVEYEYINYEFPSLDGDLERRDYNSLLIGGGLAQPVSDNVTLLATALYNLLYEDTYGAPYSSPLIIRLGFTVGF